MAHTFFIYKDKAGAKWKFYPRGWFLHIITSQRRLEKYKENAANERCKKGHEAWAKATEAQSMFRFIDDAGLLVRRERIEE